MRDVDILVAGGGVAGLTAAAAFGAAGFGVLCVDPAPPVTRRDDPGADMRTTALLQPARALLSQAGVWDAIATEAAPLQVMRIVDAGGPTGAARRVKDFDAIDVSDLPFGWNVPNWHLRAALLDRLSALANVDFAPGLSAETLFTRTKEARVGLSDGTRIRARLVIAADGRNSAMRRAAGIDVQTQRYGQKAIACAVHHDAPHHNVSTEIHRTGGPFTLVPLPDRNGCPCSALVWMDDAAATDARMQMDEATFNAAMDDRSAGLYGPLRLASPRAVWPIISQRATSMAGERLALIAEAAHVVPPIGAQGLNMSLADTKTLLDLATAAPQELGTADMLARYEKARMADVRTRVAGIDLLNRASQVHSQPLKDARMLGLDALYAAKPVRQMLMQMGLGLKTQT